MAAAAPVSVPLNVSAPVTFGLLAGVNLSIGVRQAVIVPAATAYAGSFPLPTLAGSTVVVAVNSYNTTNLDIPAVTRVTLGGSAGNFAQAASAFCPYAISSVYLLAALWIGYNVPAGQTAVVVSGNNLTLNNAYGIVIYEITGLTTITSPVDRAAAAAASVAGTAWSSGATAVTRSANEIWFGTATGGGVLGLPGWISEQEGNLAASYQVQSAEAAATYAGTSSSSPWAAAVATLTGGLSAGGTAQIGPGNQREVWYPQVVSVSASTAMNQAACSVYAGPDTTQPNFVWSTPNGSTGDSTANVSGPGLTIANLPGRAVNCNEYVFAVWQGGDFGAQGRLNIQGTKVIGSGGPPGWTHVRTRKLG